MGFSLALTASVVQANWTCDVKLACLPLTNPIDNRQSAINNGAMPFSHMPGLMRMLDCRERFVCLAGDEYDNKYDAKRRPTWRRPLAAWEWMQTRIIRPKGRGYWFWGRSRQDLDPFLRSVFVSSQAEAMLSSGIYIHTFREGKRLNHVSHDLITMDSLPEKFEDRAPVVALYADVPTFDAFVNRLDKSHQVLWLPWTEHEMHEQIVAYDMAEFRLE